MPAPDVHPLPGREIVCAVPGAQHVDGQPAPPPVRLHVVEHGRRPEDGGGLPLVMLHGLPATSYLWRHVARDLERERLCVMPDLVGCGESERPSDPRAYRLEEQAALLLGLLDRLGLGQVAVLGNDLGGAVAVHLAALAGPRVRALVLSGAPIHDLVWPTPPVVPLLLPGTGPALLGLLRARPGLARRLVARALGARLDDRELDRYLSSLRSPEDATALLRLVRAVDLHPVERAWEGLRHDPVPTLVLWGERDRLRSPAYGRRLTAEMPGAVWAPISDAGHLVPAERPERVAEEVGGFLADLS